MINTSRSCSTTSQCNSTPNVFGNLSSQITFTVLFWNQNLIKKKTVKLFLHLWFESVSNKNIYHASLIYCTFFFFDNFHFEKLWQQKKELYYRSTSKISLCTYATDSRFLRMIWNRWLSFTKSTFRRFSLYRPLNLTVAFCYAWFYCVKKFWRINQPKLGLR